MASGVALLSCFSLRMTNESLSDQILQRKTEAAVIGLLDVASVSFNCLSAFSFHI